MEGDAEKQAGLEQRAEGSLQPTAKEVMRGLLRLSPFRDDLLPEEKDELRVVGHYGNGSDTLRARWQFYELAREPLNFYAHLFEDLELSGNETIADIGCGYGEQLIHLGSELNHQGRLIGIDYSKGMCREARLAATERGLSQISIINASAHDLPLKTSSVDITMALFMLYYTDVGLAISELQRVSKQNGLVVIATSGEDNKWRGRNFEKRVSEFLRIDPPNEHTTTFDEDVAEQTLPYYFEVIREFVQRDRAIVKTDEHYQKYIGPIWSMRKDFDPVPSVEEFQEAIDKVVRPDIMRTIESRGYFYDQIDRRYYLCKNVKDSTLPLF